MTRRALVTGGAGFIGSHVADRFIGEGWEVEIVDDLSSGKRANVPEAAKLHVADIRSPEAARSTARSRMPFSRSVSTRRSLAPRSSCSTGRATMSLQRRERCNA